MRSPSVARSLDLVALKTLTILTTDPVTCGSET